MIVLEKNPMEMLLINNIFLNQRMEPANGLYFGQPNIKSNHTSRKLCRFEWSTREVY